MRQGRLPNVLLKPLQYICTATVDTEQAWNRQSRASELCGMIRVGMPVAHFQLTCHAETDAFIHAMDMLLPDVQMRKVDSYQIGR